jgi:hypothetical protein
LYRGCVWAQSPSKLSPSRPRGSDAVPHDLFSALSIIAFHFPRLFSALSIIAFHFPRSYWKTGIFFSTLAAMSDMKGKGRKMFVQLPTAQPPVQGLRFCVCVCLFVYVCERVIVCVFNPCACACFMNLNLTMHVLAPTWRLSHGGSLPRHLAVSATTKLSACCSYRKRIRKTK